MFNPACFREHRLRLEIIPNAAGGGTVLMHEERLRDGRFQLIHIKTASYDDARVHDGLVAVGFY